ncbi:hypothetical protein NEOKW01_1035 [Nematocida sp. AWRm80]|nr:hypothetical protein NEOKW01_1035 [Nematocida sp. AWRm80]
MEESIKKEAKETNEFKGNKGKSVRAERIKALDLARKVAKIKKDSQERPFTREELQYICPNVAVEKYKTQEVLCETESVNRLFDSPSTNTKENSPNLNQIKMPSRILFPENSPTRARNESVNESTPGKSPIHRDKLIQCYLAPIEQAILYTKNYSHEQLENIIDVIHKYIRKEDLIHIHRILSHTLITSSTYEYSNEYDRWIVLMAIRMISLNREVDLLMEYFPAIVKRIDSTNASTRDRTLILSDYITHKELTANTPESTYFYSYIESSPVVEEDDDSVEEDSSVEECITTIAEYYDIIKQPEFETTSPKRKKCIIEAIFRILPAESLKGVKRYYLSIIEQLSPIGTEESLRAISELLSVEDLCIDALKLVYKRDKYSFYFRHLIVLCTIQAVNRLSHSVCHCILNRFSEECSTVTEESKKLDIPALLLAIRNRIDI